MDKTCGREDVTVPTRQEGLAVPPSPGCVPGRATHVAGLISAACEKPGGAGCGRRQAAPPALPADQRSLPREHPTLCPTVTVSPNKGSEQMLTLNTDAHAPALTARSLRSSNPRLPRAFPRAQEGGTLHPWRGFPGAPCTDLERVSLLVTRLLRVCR